MRGVVNHSRSSNPFVHVHLSVTMPMRIAVYGLGLCKQGL